MGQYTEGGIQYPMLVYRNSAGVTYKIKKATLLPTAFNNNGNFKSVTCVGTKCVAVGQYTTTGSKVVPMAAYSSDSGASWNYPIDFVAEKLPVDFNDNGSFNSVSCATIASTDVCVAVGKYTDNGGSPKQNPLIATSTDGGATWAYTLTATSASPPVSPSPTPTPIAPPNNFDNNGVFNSVSCSSSGCVAVGSYVESTGTKKYPMLATSADGIFWTYRLDSGNVIPNFDSNGELLSVSCEGARCSAVGSYYDGTHKIFLGAHSTTFDTWSNSSYELNSATTPTPAAPFDTSDRELNSVSCYATGCMAVGKYTATSNDHSMVAKKRNSDPWSYSVDLIPPTYNASPSAPDSGVFYGSYCNTTACLAAGAASPGGIPSLIIARYDITGDSISHPVLSDLNAPTGGPFAAETKLTNVHCSSNICFASGTYTVGLITYPVLMLSANGDVDASTWHYVVDKNNELPELSYGGPGQFNAVYSFPP